MAKSDYIKDRKTGKLLGRIGRGKREVPEASKLTPSTLSTADSAINEAKDLATWDAEETIKIAVSLGANIPAINGTKLYKVTARYLQEDYMQTSTESDEWSNQYVEYEIVLGSYSSDDEAYEVLSSYVLSNYQDQHWKKGTKENRRRLSTGLPNYEETEFSLWAAGKTPREIVEKYYGEEHPYDASYTLEEIVVGKEVNAHRKLGLKPKY